MGDFRKAQAQARCCYQIINSPRLILHIESQANR